MGIVAVAGVVLGLLVIGVGDENTTADAASRLAWLLVVGSVLLILLDAGSYSDDPAQADVTGPAVTAPVDTPDTGPDPATDNLPPAYRN